MKIKIIHHPYYNHKIGDIVDLGEEINASLISFGRAVWVTNAKPTSPLIKKILTKKKILTNRLREEVEAAKQDLKEELVGKPEVVADKSLLTNPLRDQVQNAKKSAANPNKKRDHDDDLI